MDPNQQNSDLSWDLHLALNENNRKSKPQRIKTYVLYKQLLENTKNDNFVTSSYEKNEISVSFHGGCDWKHFAFDKILHSDACQTELSDSVAKSVIQDLIVGLNNFLIVCKLSSPYVIGSFESRISFCDVDSVDGLIINLLKELLLFAKKENVSSSLHASYFEVHDDKIIDLLSTCQEYRDMKTFEVTEQNYIVIEDLMEKPIIDDKDIFELFTRESGSLLCAANCCHSVLSVSLVRKDINCEGFEFIRVGKLVVVNFAKCKNTFLGDTKNCQDCLMKLVDNQEFTASSKSKIFHILKPAFGGNAKTSIIIHLSSILHSLEKDLSILQFLSEARKTLNYPEINLKLIIPDSLKEYAEEIKDLQKEINATSNSSGIMLENLMYRFFKNSLSLEDEIVKSLNYQLSSLTKAAITKKQDLMNLHAINESTESEIKEVVKSSEILKLEMEKMKKNNIIEKICCFKADEIIALKQSKMDYEFYGKKLKLELIKTNRHHEAMVQKLHYLEAETASILCHIDAEKTSLKSTLELLMVDVSNTLSDFQNLRDDLSMELNHLTDFDALFKTWKQNIDNLLSKFSSFIDDHERSFIAVKLEMNALHTFQNETLEIIRNNKNDKWPVLSYYFDKVQILCDSSFKILAEIIHQLDVIQICYKAELKTIGTALCSSRQTFKKFVSDVSIAVKSFQHYFEDRELQMTDKICFHHNFKKQFDEKIGDIKQSLLSLKKMCLGHNETTISKWNEIQKDCNKTLLKHIDVSEHLSVVHKEMSKYLDNLAQQKLNILDYSSLKDKTNNVESCAHQLLQMHKKMKGDVGEASEVHKKGIDKELLEVKEYMNSQKAKIQKHFDMAFLKIKTTAKSFQDELECMQQLFSNSEDELKKKVDLLLSALSCLATIYDNYASVSSSILEKSERSFKLMPPVCEAENDDIADTEDFFLDSVSSKLVTSTPNIPEKKDLNLAYEKEKLLCRIRSIAEHQLSQKLNICDLDSEEKNKNNISTVSLPNLDIHSKVPIMTEKNLAKLKLTKR